MVTNHLELLFGKSRAANHCQWLLTKFDLFCIWLCFKVLSVSPDTCLVSDVCSTWWTKSMGGSCAAFKFIFSASAFFSSTIFCSAKNLHQSWRQPRKKSQRKRSPRKMSSKEKVSKGKVSKGKSLKGKNPPRKKSPRTCSSSTGSSCPCSRRRHTRSRPQTPWRSRQRGRCRWTSCRRSWAGRRWPSWSGWSWWGRWWHPIQPANQKYLLKI